MLIFGGLISGVMGRAAEGYGKAADMEMKKQGELDLKKQTTQQAWLFHDANNHTHN